MTFRIHHRIVTLLAERHRPVRRLDFPGTVGDNGIVPGTTYWYETVTFSPKTGQQVDNNEGKCYSVTIPTDRPAQ